MFGSRNLDSPGHDLDGVTDTYLRVIHIYMTIFDGRIDEGTARGQASMAKCANGKVLPSSSVTHVVQVEVVEFYRRISACECYKEFEAY
jgi:hypothetical protein